MTRLNSRIVLPIATGLLGALWLVYGLIQYGWWGDNGPQSGFFPAIVGTLLIFVSIVAILGARKQTGPSYVLASFFPVVGVISIVLAAFLIGFFPALFLFVLGWIRYYEKYPWGKSLLTSVVTIGAAYGIFSLWLRVPFPEGLILEAIRG